MVDPLTATLTTRAVTYVVGVALNMQSLSQTAKVNKEQALLLAKRVQVVADYLKEMDTRRELLNIPRIDEILQELMETVGRAEELIQDYAAKNKWHKRLLTTGSFRASFADINSRLSNTLQMLDLGLSIHQTLPVFASDLDAKAEEVDLADIRNQLDLIIDRQAEEHKLLSAIYDRQQELSDKTVDSLKEYMQTVVISAQPVAKDRYAHLEIPFWRLCFEEQIGRGGFGVVYKGTYQGEPVAIKQLDVDRLGPVALKEFKNEIDVLSRITSRYIPRLYGICTEQGRYCIVMEFMPRGNLSEVLRDTDLDLPWSLRYRMALESARAMQLLYANGIQHRDFKSLNVLLDEYLHCKVSDFGLSKCKSTILTTTQAGGTSTLASAMNSAATLCWLAPERMRIGARFDESCDSYSFGVTLYEIASRSLPFAGEDPFVIRMSIMEGVRPEIPEDTPREFAELICSCWAHDPKRRPLFTEIVRRLEVMLGNLGSPVSHSIATPNLTASPLHNSIPPAYSSRAPSGLQTPPSIVNDSGYIASTGMSTDDRSSSDSDDASLQSPTFSDPPDMLPPPPPIAFITPLPPHPPAPPPAPHLPPQSSRRRAMTPAPGGFRHRKAQQKQQQQQQQQQQDLNGAMAEQPTIDAHMAAQRESRRRARSSEPRSRRSRSHAPNVLDESAIRVADIQDQIDAHVQHVLAQATQATAAGRAARSPTSGSLDADRQDALVDAASVSESATSTTAKSDKGKKPSFLAAAMSAALAAISSSKKKQKEDKYQEDKGAAKKKDKPKIEFKIKFGSDSADPKQSPTPPATPSETIKSITSQLEKTLLASAEKAKLDIHEATENALMFKVKDKDGVEHQVPLQVPLAVSGSKLKSKGKSAGSSTSDHEPITSSSSSSSSSSRSNSNTQSPVTTESDDSDGWPPLSAPPTNGQASHSQRTAHPPHSSPHSPALPAPDNLHRFVSFPNAAQQQTHVNRSLIDESLAIARPRVIPRSTSCKIEFHPLSHTIGHGVNPNWSVGDKCTFLPTPFDDYHHGYMRATAPGRGDPALLPLFSVSARSVHYSAAPFLPHSVPIVAHAMDQHTSTSLVGSRPPIFVCDSSMGIQMLNLPSSQWAREPISMNRLTLSAVSQTVRNPEITDLFQGWTGSSRFAMGYLPRTHSLYLIGGGRSAKHQMSVVDIESGWISPADCPYPGWTNHTVIHADGALYAGSGGTSSRRFAHFDPREKQWNKLDKWDAVSNFNLRTQLVYDQHSQSILKMAVGGNLRQVASSAELYDIRAAKWMPMADRFPSLAGSGGEGVQYLGRSIVRNVGLSMMWRGHLPGLAPSWYPVLVIDAVSQIGGQESLALWDMVADRCMRYDQVDSEGTATTPWRSAGTPVLCGHDPSAGYISIARSQADECMVRRIVLGPEVSMEV